jgi:dihydrofolate reductase
MEIVLIAAVARNGCIGDQGRIPWRYPADLRHFRRVTDGHPVLMGRRTWESLPQRPLPGRLNLVISRRSDYPLPPGAVLCADLTQALAHCRADGAARACVIGGAAIYRLALPLADEMILTRVPDEPTGDVSFPSWSPEDWALVDQKEKDGLAFLTYRRRRPA